MKLHAQLLKVDEAKRLVIGRAVQETPDRSDEIFDYETSKPYFVEWSKSVSDDTDGKSLGNLRAMHGKTAAGKITKMDFNDAEKAIDIEAKIVDDNEWAKVLEGVYTGFSIGGSYVGQMRAEKMDGKDIRRYTAKPVEISIVDSPCIPTCKVFNVQKADGSILEKAFVIKSNDDELQVNGSDSEVGEFAELLNKSKLSMSDAIEAIKAEIAKREFDEEKRKKDAKSGAAMADGSYPIETVSDLENAVQAYGRAKDPEAVKAHIISRAKSLGAESKLPVGWDGSTKEKVEVATVEKAGSRHSKQDMDRLQAAHDHLSSMGAMCKGDTDDDGDMDGKAVAAAELAKSLDLAKKLDDALARIKVLESQPMPSVVTMRMMGKAVTKIEDASGQVEPPLAKAVIDPDTVDLVEGDQLVRNYDGSIDIYSSKLLKSRKMLQKGQ